MNKWKKTFGIHICCSVLVVAFLVAVPILSSSQPAVEAGAAAEITTDPLGRLPDTPDEAHQRLEEREVAWPEAPEGDFDAAAIVEGVQSGVRVAIPYDSVEGFITHPGANVKVDLFTGAILQQTNTVTARDDGWFKADMSTGDIQTGDTVVITDLAGGPAVNINCTLTGNIDFTNNRVIGNTVAGNIVDTYILAPSTYYADIPPGAIHRQVTAGGGGGYTANIPNLDVRRGDAAFVFSTNGNGNKVMEAASGSGAGLVVYPQYDDVMGFYIPGVAITVNAGAASRNVTAMKDGFFEAWFTDHDILPGQTVSANMGGARSIIVRNVSASCDPATNRVAGIGPANRPMRITMDPYGTPVIYQTTSNGAGVFAVNLGSGYTATGTDVYNVTSYDPDGDCTVYEFQTFSWYLAEGYTGGSFDTWVLVQNPGDTDALVTLTFQLQNGTAAPYSFGLPAGTRKSVHLDELPELADAEVSTKVTSNAGNWIVAERAEYFVYGGDRPGGHDSIGSITPSTTWYLAEGYTGGTFDTWVLVQNPGTEDAMVTLSFQLPAGNAADPHTFLLAAGTRQSVHLDELPGLIDTDVSTKVTSDKPVVAERAEYFIYAGDRPGGHDSIGTNMPATTWYLAEGYTGGDFDTWVLVQNPGLQTATVTLSFQLVNGTADSYTFELPGGARESVHLDELPELADAEVSTKVSSNRAVVAERAVYFIYDGKPGGTDSIGVPEIF